MGQFAPVDGSTIELVLISHGHNVGSGELGTAGKRLADKSAFSYPNAEVVTILPNPERPSAENAAVHEQNIDQLRERLARNNLAKIDVNPPYKAMPGWESAYDTPSAPQPAWL